MWPNPHETAYLVTFLEEILNGKLHFLCSEWYIGRTLHSLLACSFFAPFDISYQKKKIKNSDTSPSPILVD